MAAAILLGGGLVAAWWPGGAKAPPAATVAAARGVVARGRIEPAERVRVIQGPAGAVLRRVNVREGDVVAAGDVLAETDQRDSALATVALEERRLDEAESQLLQVTAPAKRSDIAAQQAVIRQRRIDLQRLRDEYDRARALLARRFISSEAEESKRAAMEQAEQALDAAESSWRSLTETRDVDAKVAAAKVEVQKAALAKARADLDLTEIHAPIGGTILTLTARAGEALGADGLLQMADMSHLLVIAEVDEADIGRVAVGQRATLSGPPLPAPIGGEVTRLSQAVFKQKRPTSDILIGRDARILEVEVRPDRPLPPVVGGEVVVDIARGR